MPTKILLLLLSHPKIVNDSKKRSNICQIKLIGFGIALIAVITTVTHYFLLLKTSKTIHEIMFFVINYHLDIRVDFTLKSLDFQWVNVG